MDLSKASDSFSSVSVFPSVLPRGFSLLVERSASASSSPEVSPYSRTSSVPSLIPSSSELAEYRGRFGGRERRMSPVPDKSISCAVAPHES